MGLHCGSFGTRWRHLGVIFVLFGNAFEFTSIRDMFMGGAGGRGRVPAASESGESGIQRNPNKLRLLQGCGES